MQLTGFFECKHCFRRRMHAQVAIASPRKRARNQQQETQGRPVIGLMSINRVHCICWEAVNSAHWVHWCDENLYRCMSQCNDTFMDRPIFVRNVYANYEQVTLQNDESYTRVFFRLVGDVQILENEWLTCN